MKEKERREGIPFGMSCEFIAEDGDTVDGSTGLEVGLQLLGRGTVVHLQNHHLKLKLKSK